MVTTRKRNKKKSSESPLISFSSIPNDIVFNIFYRISLVHYTTLSLVSKSLPSLLTSRELYATRTLIGNTEKCFYLCLSFRRNNTKPCWYTLSKQHKPIPIPSLPYVHPKFPSVVSTDSEIYIIGGYIRNKRSRYVFLLDCRSHQWRRLPDMLFPRGNSAAGLIQGKIYVFGGCYRPSNKNWGEIYDPKTQSWEPLSSTTFTPDVRFLENMEQMVSEMVDSSRIKYCFVGEKKILWKASLMIRDLHLDWCDLEYSLTWRKVKGLEGFSASAEFISVTNSDEGRGLQVWWVSYITNNYRAILRTEIWCAEISLERRSRDELFGTVECSEMIYTIDHHKSLKFKSLLCSATVTH